MTLSASEVHAKKKAPTVEGVLPLFHERWSPRSFDDREVSPETLAKVFEAARWAASSFNEQPWRFLLGRRGDSAYRKIFASLVEFNQKWAQTAPVLILGMAKTSSATTARKTGMGCTTWERRVSYLTLQAAELGLTTHQMAGFDLEAARKALRDSRGVCDRIGDRAGLPGRTGGAGRRHADREGDRRAHTEAADELCFQGVGRAAL